METPASYTLELTHNEMVALIKYHCAQARAIPKKLGKISLQMAAESPALKMREMKALNAHAQQIIDHHSGRAKGILSLIEAAKKG